MLRRLIDTVFAVMFALILSVFFIFCNPVNANAAVAGDPDYVSIHSYASPTELKGVYRVVNSITIPPAKAEKSPVYVAITLDGSASMWWNDIYDSSGRFTTSGTPGTVSRYIAMEAAVEAALASLIADGNKKIYINISSHDGNSTDPNDAGWRGTPTGMPLKLNALADASGFVSLYDSSGNVRSIFDSANRGSGFVMDGWPDLNDQTPSSNPGGWSGYAYCNDFALAFERLHGIFSDGLINGTIPTNSARYILAMGDGADSGAEPSAPTVARSTQEWATAIKAPLDANYKVGGSIMPSIEYAGTGSGGLGAVIWSVAVGKQIAHDISWKTDVFQPNWQTIMAVTGYALSEPRLIYNSVPIPESQANNPNIIYGVSAPKVWSDAFINATLQPWYSGQIANNAADGDTHYTYSCFLFDNDASNSYRGTSLAAGFADFGEAATSAATLIYSGLDSEMNINSQAYNLYKFPGKPLLETLSSDPTASINATVNGNQISWNIAQLSSETEVTLIFYIKMDDSLLDSSDYYPVFDSATLTYIPATSTTGLPVTVSFPVIYISGKGNTKSDDSTTTSATATEVSTPTIQSEGLIPIAGIAGNDGKPYTPSVTPQSNMIQNESLQEESQSVPVTSDSTRIVIIVSAILAVSAAYILYRKRKKF